MSVKSVHILTQGTCTLVISCLFLLLDFHFVLLPFFIVAELLSSLSIPEGIISFLPSPFFTTRAHCGRSYFHLVSILYWYRGVQGSLEMWKIEKRSTILTKFKKKYFSLAFSEFQWFSVIFLNLIQLWLKVVFCQKVCCSILRKFDKLFSTMVCVRFKFFAQDSDLPNFFVPHRTFYQKTTCVTTKQKPFFPIFLLPLAPFTMYQ